MSDAAINRPPERRRELLETPLGAYVYRELVDDLPETRARWHRVLELLRDACREMPRLPASGGSEG